MEEARESGRNTDVLIRVQRLLPAAQLPRYAHTGPFGDLAADLFAAETAVLAAAGQPGSTIAVRTGQAIELPSTHGALIEDRSGLAVRGVTTLAGVIDPGYRGELRVVLTNFGGEPFRIAPGHRIAQLRIVERITSSPAQRARGAAIYFARLAAAKTSRALVVPSTFSVPATPKPIHPELTPSIISS